MKPDKAQETSSVPRSRLFRMKALRRFFAATTLVLASLLMDRASAAQTFVRDLNIPGGSVDVVAVAVHPRDGSVYVAGRFGGDSLQLGQTVLRKSPLSTTKWSGFVGRMENGAWIWARGIYSGQNDVDVASITVTENNIYVAGSAELSVGLSGGVGAEISRATGLKRAPFVMKLDTQGSGVWVNMAENFEAAPARAYDMTVDPSGNVFVCGSFATRYGEPGMTNGLRFGTWYPFHARDSSGPYVAPDNREYYGATRDGFLAKLTPGGEWSWVASGGGAEDADGGFFGCSVDNAGNVYVIANGMGQRSYSSTGSFYDAKWTVAMWTVTHGGGGTLPHASVANRFITFGTPDDKSRPVLGKIIGSGNNEGHWVAVKSVEDRLGGARDLVWANGTLFTAYQSTPAETVVERWKADLSAREAAIVTAGGTGNQLAFGTSLAHDGNGSLYLGGTFSASQVDFVNPGGNQTLRTTAGNSLFLARIDTSVNGALRWDWLAKAEEAFGETTPDFNDSNQTAVGVDRISGRVYFGGQFHDGALQLGPETSRTRIPAASGAVQGALPRGYVSAVTADGKFLESVNLTILSQYGGTGAIHPFLGTDDFISGETLTASVPPVLYFDGAGRQVAANDETGIRDRAVVRHTCIGYEVLETAVAGPNNSYTLTVSRDTRLRFNWKTEFALEIKNNRAGTGVDGLTSDAAGNPDPVVLKHWVLRDEIATAFIDGVVSSPTQFGTRFRSTGYQASGSSVGALERVTAFNGTDESVNVGTFPNVSFSGGVTLETWVNFDRFTEWAGLMEFANTGSDAIYISTQGATRDINFRVYQGASPAVNLSTTGNQLSTGQWFHIAATLGPDGVATIYINGRSAASVSVGPNKLPPAVSRTVCNLGYGPASVLSRLAGRMGETRIWNTVRSAEQIRSAMFAGLSGRESGLMGYWKFSEVTAPAVSGGSVVVPDLSVTAQHGAFVNGDASNVVAGGISMFFPWAGVQERQQVPQFIMSGPAVVEYRWVRENRVQVGAVPASIAGEIRTFGGGVTNSGPGEFWFTNGAAVRITVPETATVGTEVYRVKGYFGGTGDVTAVNGDGTVSGTVRYYDIPVLTQGSSLTWDYGDFVFKGRVLIGQAINFLPGGTFTGEFAIPSSARIDSSSAPVATTIVSGSPPGSSVEDMRVWDDVADKLYPLRPGVILLEWRRQSGASSRNVLTEITVAYPTNADFVHIGHTPPVPLDDDKTNTVAFLGLKYAERDALVTDTADFSANEPGWNVLLFSERTDGTAANGDLNREILRVRTVQTRLWSTGLQTAPATIGSPVVSALHSPSVSHNGYVFFEKARYNADIYNRASLLGPIIPVNRFPGARTEENLVVVWYRQQEGINWPYQAVQYAPEWPRNSASRIVIASRLGSEGFDTGGNPQLSFDPARYQQVKIYNQPDRSRPGYNPNEEHALIAASQWNASAPVPPPAAFALRNNLNVTNETSAYTSDPFVLVQYFDSAITNYAMAAYPVLTEDIALPARRLDFSATATNGTYLSLGAGGLVEFNYSSFASLTGLRTNEPVDLVVNEVLTGAEPGRYRIVRVNDGRFTLRRILGDTDLTASSISRRDGVTVSVSRAYPYQFEYQMLAGEPVVAPYPLQQVIGAVACGLTHGENLDPSQLVYWEDHKGQPWAVSGSANPAHGLRARFYYPLQPEFWHPSASPGDCIAYVSNSAPIWVTNHVAWPARVPTLKAGESLTYSGGEVNRDDANLPGVSGVVGWAAGRIVFDGANPALESAKLTSNYLARLAAPLLEISVSLPLNRLPSELLPASGNVTVNGTAWTFDRLDASLQSRVRYDQSSQKLSVRGFLDGKTLGDPALTAAPGSIPLLQPNILTPADSNALVRLVGTPSADWTAAVSNLVQLSRDPNQALPGAYGVGLVRTNGVLRPASQFGPGLALVPNQRLLDPAAGMADGYLTLAENDDPALGDAPVALHIVRIQKSPLFRGAIKTLNPSNPFDEKITLRHSGDFGGNSGDLVFEWYYRPDDGSVIAPPDSAPANAWQIFPDASGNNGRGLQEINVSGSGAVALTDNRFFVRWRHANSAQWSQWAGAANSRPPASGERPQDTYVPQLAEGWVKRVIAGINPFDARVTDFRNNNTPATYASMVQQAGAPYRGPVALNASQNVVENVGLIELYSTVLNRAASLSINLTQPVTTPAVNNTLLLAASRIADLQLLLANEAYTDAQDPTIGFGSTSVEYGSLAPTIFTFQNQMPSLLDEELALLRGRSEEGAYPVYNRLLWNFTRAEGEAAYALSYGIRDANTDGFINETDARIQFPQGHGDAWGDGLSALRTYYDLLRHPNFNWQARSESLQIDGVVLSVDYLDERKFAQAAAAKARTGSEIVNLTYRSRFVEDPDGQWQGYQDTDTARAWGVSDWARRAGTGALLDWVTANAILPSSDTNHTGIQKVDRSTVKDIAQISAQAVEIRKQLDNANVGLNPIGLATDVVPFDIDPIGFDPAIGVRSTHFDQVYERALKTLGNAVDVFNHANQLNNMLRQVASTSEQFAQDAAAQDLDFRNRLIEIFGTPYEGVIGPGKAYPAGYSGPDIYLYMYNDVTGLQDVPPASEEFTGFFSRFDNGFVNAGAPGGGGASIAAAFGNYFPGDAPPDLQSNTNVDFSGVLAINMPRTASGYSFQAPASWGRRRTPGEVQQVLLEMVQAEADLQIALHDYDGLIGDIRDAATLLRAQSGLRAENIRIQEDGRTRTIAMNSAIFTAGAISAHLGVAAENAGDTAEVAATAIPGVVGLAQDAFSTVRSVIRGTGRIAVSSLRQSALVADQAAAFLENTKEVAQIQQDIEIAKDEFRFEIQEQLKEFEALLGDEAKLRIEAFRKQEALRQISGRYRSVLESGLRLLEERELHNKKSAGATQQNRYQDFTFRVARNDALAKYRAAFDLAARYVYLAAKAYDYETNLDPNDPGSARQILTQIIHARTLGAMDNGGPRLGSGGLADALATLKINFESVRSQMGLNNPQGESGQFSLRHELFRMKGADGAAWRRELEKLRVADLWQVPEFRRFCRPFAPQSAGAQPGLVIPFTSQVIFGKNFFGWPLGPGDSAYDPTLYATKVRSVGVWFDGYAGEGLSTTPRVYLVPAGLDIMYVPNSAEFATREWNIVDQKIPVPLPVSQAGLRDPSWIPVRDSLNGTLSEIRRYSSFRAYHNSGFTQDQMSFDSRLVGRSVWNTRWLLIIPGGTFLADQTEGLDTFIHGLKSAAGTATDSRGNRRDGNGVQDIKLSFQTYAISGN